MSNGTASGISDHGDKLQLLNNLSSSINGTVYLKMWCDQNQDQTNSNNYALRLNRLNALYTTLSNALWKDWIGDAATVKKNMQAATRNVNQSVKNIQSNVNTAQNIVKALGYLDQAVAIAAKLAP
ncbi:MAG: hypothetical protein ABSD31_01975 [Candidatus Binataceae bacterium]|jgi:hypothetical protein